MSVVNQLLTESADGLYQNQMSAAMKLSNKWKKSGLLEGLGEQESANMSVLLENQTKRLIVENTTNQGGASFTAGQGEQYAAVALPLVRKVFGQIAAKEFVSIQPMSLPAGLVFFLDFQYGNTKSPFAKGDSLYGSNSSGNVFSNDAQGGLYGAGRFGYSTNQFASVSASGVFGAVTNATMADVNYDATYSASVAANTLKVIPVATGSLPSFDTEGVRAFMISGSGVNPTNILQAFTTKANAAGNIIFIHNGIPTLTDAVILYNKQTKDNFRGDYEDSNSGTFSIPNAASATTIAIPEFNISMKSDSIIAKTKKLKASWTPEFSQDLNAFQSIDAEAEVTGLMSEYISLEIDMEILDMLIQDAPTTEYWSAKVGLDYSGGTFSNVNNAGLYYTKMSWFQTLGIKMQKISNKIHQQTLRGGANFMVVSPTVATVLESIPGFSADSNDDVSKAQYAFGVQKVGSLNSQYKVYKNPYMIENTILMGFRGNQFLETGAVYAPYIPVMTTPLVYDPETFTPRKGIMTRYAKKMLRPEFYAKIVVADLDSI